METKPLIIERKLNAPAHQIWQALTDNTQMSEWYFRLDKFEPRVGFEFSFTAGAADKQYVHLCRVTAVDPEKN